MSKNYPKYAWDCYDFMVSKKFSFDVTRLVDNTTINFLTWLQNSDLKEKVSFIVGKNTWIIEFCYQVHDKSLAIHCSNKAFYSTMRDFAFDRLWLDIVDNRMLHISDKILNKFNYTMLDIDNIFLVVNIYKMLQGRLFENWQVVDNIDSIVDFITNKVCNPYDKSLDKALYSDNFNLLERYIKFLVDYSKTLDSNQISLQFCLTLENIEKFAKEFKENGYAWYNYNKQKFANSRYAG